MSSPAQPTPQPTDKAGTKYVILKQDPTGAWQDIVRDVDAPSAAAAIRGVADLRDAGTVGGEGLYVAIPARSWKPVKVTVETTKTVRLG